jgi:hypothetical protein
LATWVTGPGAAYFSPGTCREINNWCKGVASYSIGDVTRASIESDLLKNVTIQAIGMYGFLNGVIAQGNSGGACACSAMDIGKNPRKIILLYFVAVNFFYSRFNICCD